MSITAEQLEEAIKTGQDVIILVNGEYYTYNFKGSRIKK